MSVQRRRPDGSWTFTTEAWDAVWYWPVGTRVRVPRLGAGVVEKSNAVSVSVRLDYGAVLRRVSVRSLVREEAAAPRRVVVGVRLDLHRRDWTITVSGRIVESGFPDRLAAVRAARRLRAVLHRRAK